MAIKLDRALREWFDPKGAEVDAEFQAGDFEGDGAEWREAWAFCRQEGRKVAVRVNDRMHYLYPRGQRLCVESLPAHYYDGDRCPCWGDGPNETARVSLDRRSRAVLKIGRGYLEYAHGPIAEEGWAPAVRLLDLLGPPGGRTFAYVPLDDAELVHELKSVAELVDHPETEARNYQRTAARILRALGASC